MEDGAGAARHPRSLGSLGRSTGPGSILAATLSSISNRRALLPVTPAALLAVARQPRLWRVAWHQWRGLWASRWWARWPPVPGPTAAYASFRTETMFGTVDGRLGPEELTSYLEWCRWMQSLTR